jgi:protein-disulfide isomerase
MISLARLALAGALLIPAAPAFAFDEAQKDEIRGVVREYLIQNPEVLFEAQQEWNRRQQAKLAETREATLESYVAKLDASKLHATLGNPKGDVTLVEFFDYNCGFCRRAIKDIDALVDADPNLRVVVMELPVIREESVGAAQVSIAVNRIAPDKFRAFHDKMLAGKALATKASALKVAKEVGVDMARLEPAMTAKDVEDTLIESKELADALGVEATPTYVVGDAVVPNTSRVVEDLKGRIAAIRKCGKAVC